MKNKLLLTTISLVLALQTMFASNITSFAAKPEITVMLDGKTLDFDVPPQIINDRTMVPMRAIFESLGYSVSWSASDKRIIAEKDTLTLELQIGNNEIKCNNQTINSDTAPQLINDRTLVPVRVIGECSGCYVGWDAETSTVILETPLPQSPTSDKNEAPDKSNQETEVVDETKLSCKTSVSKSIMSVGGYYRIVFSAVASGQGGTAPYKYRYELIQNGKITKKSSFSAENAVEGSVEGSGECKLIFYVKDSTGSTAQSELDLTK